MTVGALSCARRIRVELGRCELCATVVSV